MAGPWFCVQSAPPWETEVECRPSQSNLYLLLVWLCFSETLSVPTFHYIYNNLLRYYEMIMVEKKEAIVWGRRSVDSGAVLYCSLVLCVVTLVMALFSV